MSVSKRKGSPHYWYDFTVGGMRFRGSCETNDVAAAKAVEAKLRTDAVLNKHLGRKPRITLDAAFTKYWKEHGQYTSSALLTTQYIMAELLGVLGKQPYLDELNDARINDLVAELRGKQRQAPATVNRKLSVISAIIQRARGWGVQIPEIAVNKHKLHMPQARTRWITPAEADKLIAHAAPHLKPIIRCALLTGLRLSNITGLKWEQVNMHARIITLRVKSKLPGGKLLEIPVSDALFTLLVEQGPQKTGPVFLRRFKPHRVTGRQREPEPLIQVRKAFRRACKRAGIADFRFHDLRHTAASWMLQNGVPLDVVQQILGHANISQTQKYAHRQAADRQAAMNALAAAQASKPQQEKAA